jgi:hypothetical protein
VVSRRRMGSALKSGAYGGALLQGCRCLSLN